jgi:hypothetical protein
MKMFSMIKQMMWSGVACLALLGGSAHAADVGGKQLADTLKVAGKDLKLNGYGMRTAMMGLAKVYGVGIYFTEPKKNVEDATTGDNGPKAAQLVMLRALTSQQFGEAFMKGFRANTDKAELGKLVGQLQTFGEMFESVEGGLKEGDVLNLEYTPGVGTMSKLNGKNMLASPMPDVAFFNALLRIWIGDKPVQDDLKAALLKGGK